MVLFQIIFIAILLLEIGVGLAVKYNYNGLQDKLVSLFMRINIEDYILGISFQIGGYYRWYSY